MGGEHTGRKQVEAAPGALWEQREARYSASGRWVPLPKRCLTPSEQSRGPSRAGKGEARFLGRKEGTHITFIQNLSPDGDYMPVPGLGNAADPDVNLLRAPLVTSELAH